MTAGTRSFGCSPCCKSTSAVGTSPVPSLAEKTVAALLGTGGRGTRPKNKSGLCHAWSDAGSRLQRSRLVGDFPGEVRLLAAEVAVARSARVDRPHQVEHLDD